MILVLLILLTVVIVILHDRQGKECLAALNAWCDASRAFVEWRLRNQGVYIGLSEEGRKFLGCNLEAYDWFLRTHPYVDGTKHRAHLVSLFYELPPKAPDDLPNNEKAPLTCGVLFFVFNYRVEMRQKQDWTYNVHFGTILL